MVADLRSYRLDARKAARLAADPLERSRLTALQSAFKILINSLYGYLASPFGHFADFEAAERVTAIGREILATMRDWLMSQGAQVIELDTDGIYFSPPEWHHDRGPSKWDSLPSCQQASRSSSIDNTKPCLRNLSASVSCGNLLRLFCYCRSRQWLLSHQAQECDVPLSAI
jgi:hypothetical protein